MEILPRKVKLSLKGKPHKGLTQENLEEVIKEVCNSFVSGKERFPKGSIVSTASVFDEKPRFPLSFGLGSEFNVLYEAKMHFAGLDLGKIALQGKKYDADIYALVEVMADLLKVPRDNTEVISIEENIKSQSLKEESIRKRLGAKRIVEDKGLITENYWRLSKSYKQGSQEDFTFTLDREQQRKAVYPIARRLHIITQDIDIINYLTDKLLRSTEITSLSKVRKDRAYPRNVLEGMRMYIERFGTNNGTSPLDLIPPTKDENSRYHHLEIGLEGLTWYKQTA